MGSGQSRGEGAPLIKSPPQRAAAAEDPTQGAKPAPKPPVDIYCWANCGYLLQYYSVGLIYGGLPATVYGLFLGYLNVPAYVYSTASVVMLMPWCVAPAEPRDALPACALLPPNGASRPPCPPLAGRSSSCSV